MSAAVSGWKRKGISKSCVVASSRQLSTGKMESVPIGVGKLNAVLALASLQASGPPCMHAKTARPCRVESNVIGLFGRFCLDDLRSYGTLLQRHAKYSRVLQGKSLTCRQTTAANPPSCSVMHFFYLFSFKRKTWTLLTFTNQTQSTLARRNATIAN